MIEPTAAPRGGVTWLARLGFPLLLVVLVFVGFAPAFGARFVNWDDEAALLATYDWRGLGGENLAWMFTTNWMGPYQPLAWFTYALDHAAVGLDSLNSAPDAGRYHATNVVLHALAALGVYLTALRLAWLARPNWRSERPDVVRFAAFVAAVGFAVHPLRAESVAWVTERRDVVSGAFVAFALWAWTFYVERAHEPRKFGRSLAVGVVASALAAILFFGSVSFAEPTRLTWGPLGAAGLAAASLAWVVAVGASACARARAAFAAAALLVLGALLGKGLALVVPMWFVILDVWPFRRIVRGKLLATLAEKAPFFALALVFAAIAGWGQRGVPGVYASFEDHTLLERFLQAGFGLAFYVRKTLLPVDLVPLVGLPEELLPSDPRYWGAWLGVLVVAAFSVWQRRRAPALLAACVGFVLAVGPVLGFTQAGPQLVADRYSYLGCLPFALLVVAALPWALERFAGARAVFVIAGLVLPLALVPMTRAQTAVWHDTDTLWRHAAAVDTQSTLARALFAIDRAGGLSDPAERERVLESSIVIVEETLKRHQKPLLLAGLAYAYQRLWELDPPRRRADAERALEAMRLADELARRNAQWNVEFAFNLGTAYVNAGRAADGVPHLEAFVAARPKHFAGRYGLGFALLRAERPGEARDELERAVELEPRHVNAWGNLALAAEKLGDRARALEAYRRVLELEPHHPTARARLAALTGGG
ncbi:MAG: tetratricopeptide repeat protein [Planctomycetes bacterium]|nr:tetratricopeptide repeat protein [Planctomycetota bacterium]